jgi:hypothetical protein
VWIGLVLAKRLVLPMFGHIDINEIDDEFIGAIDVILRASSCGSMTRASRQQPCVRSATSRLSRRRPRESGRRLASRGDTPQQGLNLPQARRRSDARIGPQRAHRRACVSCDNQARALARNAL